METSTNYSFQNSTSSAAEEIQMLIVCTKAYDAAEGVSRLTARLSNSSKILLLNNGLGAKEEVVDILQSAGLQATVFEGIISHGVYRISADTICHAGYGNLCISSTSADLRNIATLNSLAVALNQLSVDVVDYSLFTKRQLEKLLINAIINPVTSIGNFSNGTIANHPALIDRILTESMAILFKAYPQVHLAKASMKNAVYKVIEKTANNRSSMLQDVTAGRRTEIDYINGALCRMAKAVHVSAPHNDLLVYLVNQRSRGLDSGPLWNRLQALFINPLVSRH